SAGLGSARFRRYSGFIPVALGLDDVLDFGGGRGDRGESGLWLAAARGEAVATPLAQAGGTAADYQTPLLTQSA
ncbi:hypothetical protein OFB83_34455, partial [Escherichia coli]|nr:hypothetical protein [Escherichia coli]